MSTKVKKVAKPAAHPPYANMITAAIKGLKDKKGSSRQAILKYVVANNKVDATKAAVRVKLALRKMVVAKKVVAAAAAGKKGAGSFKLPAKEPKAKPVKAKKPNRGTTTGGWNYSWGGKSWGGGQSSGSWPWRT